MEGSGRRQASPCLPLAAASRRLAVLLERSFSELDIKAVLRRHSALSSPLQVVRAASEVDAARRDEVRAILDRSEGVLFSAQSLDMWRGPVVYVALKAGLAVYVGRSRHGLRRVFSRHHKPEAFEGAELMVWSLPNVQDMERLEQLLIAGLRPPLNVVQPGPPRG